MNSIIKNIFSTLLIVFWTNISFAEVVGLTCKLGDKKFYAGLDFTNSKWVNEDGRSTYMSYTEDVIATVKRTKGDIDLTHSLWIISRITGVGEIKGYKLTEEDLKVVTDRQLNNIVKNKIGDLSKRSLDPARNKLRAHTFVEYLLKRPNKKVGEHEVSPIKTEFECEKAETKYKF
tara:strand:- start:1230 stop:1754 length:525 start_codon:yes stop_codon:yes gene_type:complete